MKKDSKNSGAPKDGRSGDKRPRKAGGYSPEKKSFNPNFQGEKGSYSYRNNPKTYNRTDTPKTFGDKPRKFDGDRPAPRENKFGDRPERKSFDGPAKPWEDKNKENRYTPKTEDKNFDRPSAKSFGDKKPFRENAEFKTDDLKPKRYSSDKSSFKSTSDKPKRTYDDNKPTFNSYSDRPKREFGNDERGPRSFGSNDKPAYKSGNDRAPRSFGEKPAYKANPDRAPRSFGDKPAFKGRDDNSKKNFDSESQGDKPAGYTFERGAKGGYQKNLNNDSGGADRGRKPQEKYRADNRPFDYADRKKETIEEKSGTIRLNRYIANSGICSRRDADELIEGGQITVNGEVITEMGHQVKPTDVIKYGNKLLSREKMVYVLLNKPKDYITTTEDPQERKTVMDLIKDSCKERVYPVGRLDRNTSGLLLLTNDGELASRLTHPTYNIEKMYQVEIDKPLIEEHFQQILKGIALEDGDIKADSLGIVTPDAMVIGIQIHSGRNRIVRRIFEKLGYEVLKLDRTVFAGLNKKDLPRGKYRFLTEKEVIKLKYLS